MSTSSSTTSAEAPIAFEAALLALEDIAARLEAGEQGLEESLRDYEAGVRLLRECHRLLESAEQRIELLTGIDGSGQPQTVAFTELPTAPATEPRTK
jgi:exodeoxyribonuclease VII small subunit